MQAAGTFSDDIHIEFEIDIHKDYTQKRKLVHSHNFILDIKREIQFKYITVHTLNKGNNNNHTTVEFL
jgi:hypothetical protein